MKNKEIPKIGLIEKCRAYAHSSAAQNKGEYWRCTRELRLERNLLLTFQIGNLADDDLPMPYGYAIGFLLEGNNVGFDGEIKFEDTGKNIDVMINRLYDWIQHFELQPYLITGHETKDPA